MKQCKPSILFLDMYVESSLETGVMCLKSQLGQSSSHMHDHSSIHLKPHLAHM